MLPFMSCVDCLIEHPMSFTWIERHGIALLVRIPSELAVTREFELLLIDAAKPAMIDRTVSPSPYPYSPTYVPLTLTYIVPVS